MCNASSLDKLTAWAGTDNFRVKRCMALIYGDTNNYYDRFELGCEHNIYTFFIRGSWWRKLHPQYHRTLSNLFYEKKLLNGQCTVMTLTKCMAQPQILDFGSEYWFNLLKSYICKLLVLIMNLPWISKQTTKCTHKTGFDYMLIH